MAQQAAVPNRRLLEAVYVVRLGIRIPRDQIEDFPDVEWVNMRGRQVPVVDAYPSEPYKVSFTFPPDKDIELLNDRSTLAAAFYVASRKANKDSTEPVKFVNLGVTRTHVGNIEDTGKGRLPS